MSDFTYSVYPTLTKSLRLSPLTKERLQHRTVKLLRKLVQFDMANIQGAGISNEDIAKILMRSPSYIAALRSKPAYLALRTEALTGVSSGAFDFVKGSIKLRKELLQDMMPDALRVYYNVLTKKPNSVVEARMQLEVAKEVMDREGSLPKISKAVIDATYQHNYTAIDGVSKEIAEMMGAAPQNNPEELNALVEQNKKFAHSDTLSAQEQEKLMNQLNTGSALPN